LGVSRIVVDGILAAVAAVAAAAAAAASRGQRVIERCNREIGELGLELFDSSA